MIIAGEKKAQSRMKSDEKSKHIEGKTTSQREGQRAAKKKKKKNRKKRSDQQQEQQRPSHIYVKT